jgi:hypothetical protein
MEFFDGHIKNVPQVILAGRNESSSHHPRSGERFMGRHRSRKHADHVPEECFVDRTRSRNHPQFRSGEPFHR